MRSLVVCSFLLALSVLAACNTIAGLGQDVKKGGEAIESIGR